MPKGKGYPRHSTGGSKGRGTMRNRKPMTSKGTRATNADGSSGRISRPGGRKKGLPQGL